MADRYTTPTLSLTVEGADLTGCDLVLTLRQGRRVLDVRGDAFDSLEVDPLAGTADIDVTLSQQQTSMFREGQPVEVQLNFVDPNGYRGDTSIAEVAFGRNLHEQVMRRG